MVNHRPDYLVCSGAVAKAYGLGFGGYALDAGSVLTFFSCKEIPQNVAK